jgi:hypothetical protein
MYAELSHRKASFKEIESSVAGEAPFRVEKTLPSFFDHYPRCKRAADLQAQAGEYESGLRLFDFAQNVLLKGDIAPMEREINLVLGETDAGGRDEEAAIVVVDDGENDECTDVNDGSVGQKFRWQVDGGDHGWLDFEIPASEAVEAGYARFMAQGNDGGADFSSVGFVGYGGNSYSLDFNFLVQRNLSTDYVRPVRRVPA